MNIPKSENPRVVIIGGGFGGLALAKSLIKEKLQVVLIDRDNYHTFQPLLYQVSTSGLEAGSIAYPLRKVTRHSKEGFFRLAEVKSISAEENTVYSDIGEVIYDYLIIATGSRTNFFGNKSVEANAMWMKTIPQALNIRSLILENLEQAVITQDKDERQALLNFVIAGAGPTGVELCGAIAELRNQVVPKDYRDLDPKEIRIHLVEGMDRVLPPMSAHASKKAGEFLKKLGVEIHLDVLVKEYDGKTVTTQDDKITLKTATFIWAAGVSGAPIKGFNASALVKKAGRYKVNIFNQIEGFENIFAIGDIALMQTEENPKGHPMLAQVAIQQGKQVAKNLKRILSNKKLEPFEYNDKGTMATIGRNKAVVDMGELRFGGFFAWFIWMFIHLYFLVGFRNRSITFVTWIYNYVNYDRASRLIIRPFKSNKRNLEEGQKKL